MFANLLNKIRGIKKPKSENNDVPVILITGGLGFIFSYVTEYFVQKGWRVIVIDNFSEGSHPEIIDGSFVHHNVHMADPDVVGLIIKEQPDYVIHAAAITDVDYSIREPYRTFKKNMMGELHVFEACRSLPNLKKLLYVGTDEVYGECDHPMGENEIILPRSPYSCSKAFGSLMRGAYENTYPILKGKIVESRMCNVFGGRQDIRKILPQIKKSFSDGHSISLHEDGVGYREYIYVKNIPSCIDLLLSEGIGVYNVSLGDGMTVRELIHKAEDITGNKVVTHTGERPGMDHCYKVDSSRLLQELQWKPKYSFEEGLREYLLDSSK